MTTCRDIILSQYEADIRPILSEIEQILMFSNPSIIIDGSRVKEVYDDETQNKINILNRNIRIIADSYKSQYPELFNFI